MVPIVSYGMDVVVVVGIIEEVGDIVVCFFLFLSVPSLLSAPTPFPILLNNFLICKTKASCSTGTGSMYSDVLHVVGMAGGDSRFAGDETSLVGVVACGSVGDIWKCCT